LKVGIIFVLILFALPPLGIGTASTVVAPGSTPSSHFGFNGSSDIPGAADSRLGWSDGVRGASQPSTWAGESYGIWVAAYSGLEVREVIQNLSPYLHAGDGVAIVLHPGGFATLNAEAQRIHSALPNVTLRAYTSLDGGTRVAGGLNRSIGKFSHLFSQLSADYEVNGPLEFSANYTDALDYFSDFSSIARGAGYVPIAYPSGRSVLGSQYGWNYGGFANVTGGQTIETQAYCGKPWKAAVSKIWSEYNTTKVSMKTLSLQLSIGRGCSEWQIIHAAKYWRQLTHGNIFFWWGPDRVREMVNILRQVER